MTEQLPASRMVERAARALCASEGCDPETWPSFIPTVETVLRATMLPRIPVAKEGPPESHPDLKAWGEYRRIYGEAGAYAREPQLPKLTGWHVRAAWMTWNGMVEAALDRRTTINRPGPVHPWRAGP